MDAIDIYTTAKLHSGNKNSSDPDDKIAQMTLSGMHYDNPETYKDITLKDVLGKVKEGDDWKSTLKESIADAKSIFTGKTREEKEDIHKTA